MSFSPTAPFPWESTPYPGGQRSQSAASHGTQVDPVLQHPYLPFPDPISGALSVDPDISLKAKGFDLELNLFYNSRSSVNGQYGKKRSISANCYVLDIVAEFGTDQAMAIRGDEKAYQFTKGSTGGGITQYSCNNGMYSGTSLVFDSGASAFIETFPDGKKITYGKNLGGSPTKYGITKIEDLSGNIHTYTYGTGGEASLIKSVQVPGGNLCTLHYITGTPTSLLNAIEDWGGRRWTLAYDANRQLTTLTTPMGCATKYGYTSDLLTRIEDPRGYATSYAYDANSRVASVAAGTGVWTYAYGGPLTWSGSQRMDPSGAITTYLLGSSLETLHPEGYRTTYVLSTAGYRTKQIEPYGTVFSTSFDSMGRPLITYDALGNITTNQYDTSGNLTTLTDALGNISSFTYDGNRRMTARIDPLGRRTTYVWNSDGTLQAIVDPRGLRTTNAYDTVGNLVSVLYSDGGIVTMQYDALGRRTTMMDQLGRITSYGYDAADHIISMTNALGEQTRWIYDSCLLVAEVDPLGNRTSYTYNRFGNRTSVQNALGYITTHEYDNMGYPTGIQDALGNRSTITYDTYHRKTADTDPLGYRTSYGYDTSSRLVEVQNARGYRTTYVLDAKNQTIATKDALGNLTTSTFDAVGRQTAIQTPLGYRSTSVFDAAGQLSATINPLGYRTTNQYDNAGNKTSVQDANNKITTTAFFTNRNLPEAVTDAMGFKTTYAFDLAGQLSSTMGPTGGVVTNQYDLAGRLSLVQNELGQNSRQYGRDAAGRVVTQMDAANRCRTMTYDAVNQITSIIYPDGGIVTNAYDPLGRRTTMVDWGGTSTYSFDSGSQMTGKTASGYVQTYDYDAVGNRTTLTLGGVGTITSTFDSLNRTESVRKPTGERYTASYDSDSRRTTLQLGNGTTRQYQFDSNSRLTTQIELNGATKICTILDGYDNVGNRITRNLDGNPCTWTYDDLYRLTGQLKAGQVCTYVMDAKGNLQVMWEGSSNPKTFTFDLADKISSMTEGSNTTTYTWTGYGALETEHLRGVRTTYTYNGQDQLIGTAVSSGLTTARSTYTFDGDGLRRTAQNGNVSPTTMVWDGSDYLFLDGPSSDQLVLTLDSEILSCGSIDLLTDPLGSLVKEISAGASLSSLVELYPYGSLVAGSFSPTIPFVFIAALGYYNDSKERDYIRARELYKLLGRWMQLDLLWPWTGPTLYAASSPTSIHDRGGMSPEIAGGSKPGKCIVKVCTKYGFANDDPRFGSVVPTHQYICAVTPLGKRCGWGMTGPTDMDAPCESHVEFSNGDITPVICRTITTDCAVAAAVCHCIKNLIKNPPPYSFPFNTCLSAVDKVKSCVMDALGLLGPVPPNLPPRIRGLVHLEDHLPGIW